jgi:hypothetical protein
VSSGPLWLVAAFFFGMGVYALAAPAALGRPFGLHVASPQARSEVRAVYGGYGLATAATLGAAALDGGRVAVGMTLAVAVALAGMAVGRVISRLMDQAAGFYPVTFYGLVEVAACSVLVLAIS